MTDKLKSLIKKLPEALKNIRIGLKPLGVKLKNFISELKKLVSKLIQLIKAHKKESVIIAAVVLAVVTVITVVCVVSANNKAEKENSESDFSWGAGLTENIPCFSENADSFKYGEGFAAAYYSNVTGEQVASYTARLEEYGIKFESDHYPRSAVLEDKVIAIHYNVTEMRFSVTVAAKQTETQSNGN